MKNIWYKGIAGLAIIAFPLTAFATTVNFTNSSTWTAPAGVTTVEAQVWADGGAGGEGGSNDNGGGGGGGGAGTTGDGELPSGIGSVGGLGTSVGGGNGANIGSGTSNCTTPANASTYGGGGGGTGAACFTIGSSGARGEVDLTYTAVTSTPSYAAVVSGNSKVVIGNSNVVIK